jgi:cytochrome c biogenesis protein CcdA
MLEIILYCYLFIAVSFYISGVIHDLIYSYKNPLVYKKYPLRQWATHKIMCWLALLWLPCSIGLLYAKLTINDHK